MVMSLQATIPSNPELFLQIITPKNKFQSQTQSYRHTTQQTQKELQATIQLHFSAY